jgi:hypothetical protein
LSLALFTSVIFQAGFNFFARILPHIMILLSTASRCSPCPIYSNRDSLTFAQGVALNQDPPDLYLPRRSDYRCGLPHLAIINNIFKILTNQAHFSQFSQHYPCHFNHFLFKVSAPIPNHKFFKRQSSWHNLLVSSLCCRDGTRPCSC